MFVTRSDTQFGLQAVQFSEPVTYPLNRLEPGNILPLLNRITSGDVVTNPGAGWDRLKRRLSQDLEASGSALPIQMTLALRGLARLDGLTIRAYERKGGLTGLEAGFIEFCINDAARRSGISPDSVRCILLKMVSDQGNKTVPAGYNKTPIMRSPTDRQAGY